MEIAQNRVVALTYTLRDVELDEELEHREKDDLFYYLHGHGNIIPGMEETLNGSKVGDTFDVEFEPKDAYGEHNPKLTQTINRAEFPDDFELDPGMIIELVPQDAGDDAQGMLFYIKEINGDDVVLDGNPPLAGKKLHFVGEVVEVREAEPEEIAHGHVHVDGEHHHH